LQADDDTHVSLLLGFLDQLRDVRLLLIGDLNTPGRTLTLRSQPECGVRYRDHGLLDGQDIGCGCNRA
ncbi:MAG: hypothetical protein OEM59_22590, partial [Rhodospirillales bacterium]|nr:hypothetical protein [Rhodospirillales bacterium]